MRRQAEPFVSSVLRADSHAWPCDPAWRWVHDRRAVPFTSLPFGRAFDRAFDPNVLCYPTEAAEGRPVPHQHRPAPRCRSVIGRTSLQTLRTRGGFTGFRPSSGSVPIPFCHNGIPYAQGSSKARPTLLVPGFRLSRRPCCHTGKSTEPKRIRCHPCHPCHPCNQWAVGVGTRGMSAWVPTDSPPV